MDSLDRLVASLHSLGMLGDSEPLARANLENAGRVFGSDHEFTLQLKNNLASLLLTQGNLAEAEPLFRVCVEADRRVLGKEHLATLIAESNWASALRALGHLDQAEALLRENLDTWRRVVGTEHPQMFPVVSMLAKVLADRGKKPEAKELYRGNLQTAHRVLGPEHPQTLDTLEAYLVLLRSERRLAEAERSLREIAALYAKTPPDDWRWFEAMTVLGECLASRQKYADAEPLLLAGYEGMKQREKTIPEQGKVRIPEAIERLVQLYEALDKQDEAAKWRKELEAANVASQPTAGP